MMKNRKQRRADHARARKEDVKIPLINDARVDRIRFFGNPGYAIKVGGDRKEILCGPDAHIRVLARLKEMDSPPSADMEARFERENRPEKNG